MNTVTSPDLGALAAEVFDTVRAMSLDAEGVSRPAFSPVETAVLDYLADFGKRHGLVVTEDAGRNRVFCRPEHETAENWVLIGSHVDSVPMGGNFDGLAGVVAGLLVLIGGKGRLAHPVKLVAMRGEESAWFGSCYLGSKMLTGTVTQADLIAAHKGDGRPLNDHLADIGIDTDAVAQGRPLADLGRIRAYLELHIEQGPLLVEKNIPAAVVTGIRGNFRYRAIRCIGQGGHSGAVPRAYRHDPVLAMADLLSRLDETWRRILITGGDLVLTSGVVGTDPQRHAIARIPDEVAFSLDIRSQSAQTLAEMQIYLAEEMADIARARGVRFETGPRVDTAPAMMDRGIVGGLLAAMATKGLDPFSMASGGGHDAAVFAHAGIPAGMIFVRNRNGSHNPDEAMELDDFLAATSILARFLEE